MSPRRKVKNKENKLPKNLMTDPEKSAKMLSEAEESFESNDYKSAKKNCDKALLFDPNNYVALELKANISLELDEFETAIQCLDKAISLAPCKGFSKYLSRAQISLGNESLSFYNKGIDLIKKEIFELAQTIQSTSSSSQNGQSSSQSNEMEVDGEQNDPEEDPESNEYKLKCLKQELTSVFCNIAELYMTDLCDEDDAQELCQAAILNGIETQPENPEPYVVKARFEIIIGNNKEALASIIKSTTLWFPMLHMKAAEQLLNFSARQNTAKVLIELKQHGEAEVVLETLLEENDQIVEFWYLMGWNRYLEGKHSHENAKEHLIKAKKVDHHFPCGDEDMTEHLDELLKELGVKEGDIDFDAVSSDEEEGSEVDENEMLENFDAEKD